MGCESAAVNMERRKQCFIAPMLFSSPDVSTVMDDILNTIASMQARQTEKKRDDRQSEGEYVWGREKAGHRPRSGAGGEEGALFA